MTSQSLETQNENLDKDFNDELTQNDMLQMARESLETELSEEEIQANIKSVFGKPFTSNRDWLCKSMGYNDYNHFIQENPTENFSVAISGKVNKKLSIKYLTQLKRKGHTYKDSFINLMRMVAKLEQQENEQQSENVETTIES